jgi:hypothetical protein
LKDEIDKILESPSNEKLFKLIVSIINLIKQNISKQVDLNYLFALPYVFNKRPQVFLDEPQLIDVIIFEQKKNQLIEAI